MACVTAVVICCNAAELMFPGVMVTCQLPTLKTFGAGVAPAKKRPKLNPRNPAKPPLRTEFRSTCCCAVAPDTAAAPSLCTALVGGAVDVGGAGGGAVAA